MRPSKQLVAFWNFWRIALAVAAALYLATASLSFAQVSQGGATLQGTVRDPASKPVTEAVVTLHSKDGSPFMTAKTDSEGGFIFSGVPHGIYGLSAGKLGLYTVPSSVVILSNTDSKHVDLVLGASGAADQKAATAAQAMQFADQPNFIVAGVTDWTAAGGHGSDSILRTSEDLTRETLALKAGNGATNRPPGETHDASEGKLRAALVATPGSFAANHQLGEFYLHSGRFNDAVPLLRAACQIDPANRVNEYDLALAYEGAGDYARASERVQALLAREDNADLHRLAGELNEKSGDPLAAVREYELAAKADPSEQNYFQWGSELLLHRAIWQAQEVFTKGVQAYPRSARMLTALGAALFAGDLYDKAAARICEASDLAPADPAQYLFLGKIETAAPEPLECVEPRLMRFAKQQPGNALANYYYAMAILKRQSQPPDARDLHQAELLLAKAVTVDPGCGDAYLQLGVLAFSQHDTAKAIDFYRKAVAADPQLAEAHYRLGVAYDRSGEAAKAKQEFELHDQIEKQQADAVERQRREIKQFLVVLQGQAAKPQAQ